MTIVKELKNYYDPRPRRHRLAAHYCKVANAILTRWSACGCTDEISLHVMCRVLGPLVACT